MKTILTDEKFDRLLKELVSAGSADEYTTEQAAESSAVWWGIQRRIREQRQTPTSHFWFVRKWIIFAAPAAAAAIVLGAIMLMQSQPASPDRLEIAVAADSEVRVRSANELPANPEPMVDTQRPTVAKRPRSSGLPLRQAAYKKARPPAVVTQKDGSSAEEEMRTEFIALSYARDPESGQIVRLKVPRSMMVTVGLVASVDKPTSLVDAEVLVGDDGLTRAIRFIR